MSLFITCGRGLEGLLDEELKELGFNNNEIGFCGVSVKDSSMRAIYAINYCSRLASRVLFPLRSFICLDQRALYQQSLKIDWSKIFSEGLSFAIDANVQHQKLSNSLYAAQIVKDAICDQLRATKHFRPDVDVKNPDLQLNLFIDEKNAVLSLDCSGKPLHKRGYRIEAGAAPLPETLASALLKLAKYEHEITVDPCAGSATLLIEAALITSNTPPGYLRKSWGFFLHPQFNREEWLGYKKEVDKKIKPLAKGKLFGCEIDREVARTAQENIKRAGFEGLIKIFCTDFIKHEPAAPYQFLITNAPYGKRLGNVNELKPLYRDLGHFMKQKMVKPARGFIFTGSPALAKEIGLSAKRRHVIGFGGLDARLLEFDIY